MPPCRLLPKGDFTLELGRLGPGPSASGGGTRLFVFLTTVNGAGGAGECLLFMTL